MAFKILVPPPGIKPGPWEWKHRVQTAGLPWNSLAVFLKSLTQMNKWHLHSLCKPNINERKSVSS